MALKKSARLRRWLLFFCLLLVARPALAAGMTPINHGPRDLARVALTFDLCQKPGHPAGFDTALVAILERNQAAATFFAGGDWMRTHPDAIRQLAAVPYFELGSHSWSHPDFRKLDAPAIASQLDRTRDEMRALTGRAPAVFRFPYGTWDQHSLEAVTAAGLKAIQWDVVTGDPDPAVSASAIVATVHRHARNGSIVIMHANGRGRHTAEALQGVIDDLRGRGLSLVTVHELLASSPAPKE